MGIESQEEKLGIGRRIRDYIRHHRRATRVEMLLLVVIFLFVEFGIPTALSSEYAKRFFEKHLSEALNYPVSFDHLNPHFSGLPMMQVGGFTIRDHQGIPFFYADDVKMELSPLGLLRGRVVLKRIRFMDGNCLAARLPNGSWNVADLVNAGYDPDHAIELDKSAVEMKNVLVTFHDQALPLPVLQHIRLRDFFISSLDLRRRTQLRMDALDEEHPGSRFEMNGNFALLIPEDISTLSGHLDLTLRHFNLQIMAPYLQSYVAPVNGWEGYYDLELSMEGKGTSPLPVSLRSKVENLKISVLPRKTDTVPQLVHAGPVTQEKLREGWIDVGSVSLKGLLKVSSGEVLVVGLRGSLAGNRFEVNGRIGNLKTLAPRIELGVKSADFELAEPVRSLLRVTLDEFSEKILDGMKGTAQVEMLWTGKPPGLKFDWRAEIKKGQYLDPQYQFELKDVTAVLRSNGDKTELESLRARVFNSPLVASGWIIAGNRVDFNVSTPALPLGSFYSYLEGLRGRGPLAAVPWLDRVSIVDGRGLVRVHVTGALDHPEVTGTLDLEEGSVRMAGISAPLNDVHGHVELDAKSLLLNQCSGSIGDAPFKMGGVLNRSDFSLREFQFIAERFDLGRYDELTRSHWMKPVELPGVGELSKADGTVTMRLDYQAGGRAGDSSPVNWPASLPDFSLDIQRANGVFSKLALPLRDFSGGITYSEGELKFEHLRGNLGNSKLSIHGIINNLKGPWERWNLKAEGDPVFPQFFRILPAAWNDEVTAQGEFPWSLVVNGARDEGVKIRGEIQLPLKSELTWANSIHKPADQAGHLVFNGVLKDRAFSITEGNVALGDISLAMRGTVNFPSAGAAQVKIDLSLGQFTPVVTLLQFVPMSVPGLKIRSGVASGSVTMMGEPPHLSWRSALRISDVSVEGMPWGKTSLTGDLIAEGNRIAANDFLAIVGNVPMRVSGAVDWGGTNPNLNFDVKNLNLDALIATIARMSAVAEPARSVGATAGKPMNIQVTASGGVFFHQPIKEFVARGMWKEGILELNPLEVQTEQGSSRAHITWNSRTNEQHMSFSAHQVPMGAFLDELLDLQLPVDGRLDVTADLTARNPNPEYLLSSFDGTVHLEASNGTLEHASLPQRLISMAAMVHEGLFGFNLGRIFQTIDPPKFKTFKHFSADATFFPNGTARLERGDFQSNLFSLRASGPINTKTEEMNIVVKGSMPEIPHGSNFLAQAFGRISIRDLYRNVRDFALLISGQHKRIKPRQHHLEFKLTGNLEGFKSIEDFHFTH
jgi:hypothetical protein